MLVKSMDLNLGRFDVLALFGGFKVLLWFLRTANSKIFISSGLKQRYIINRRRARTARKIA
uniref:Uncharacterized protein n=1 Tax=Glossina palpalis gambiensis TaxID=67801 RepID=A0A1B0BZP5_9MUSC